jgi:hypothetical protein
VRPIVSERQSLVFEFEVSCTMDEAEDGLYHLGEPISDEDIENLDREMAQAYGDGNYLDPAWEEDDLLDPEDIHDLEGYDPKEDAYYDLDYFLPVSDPYWDPYLVDV